jgi:hypothetical protein
MELKEQIRWSNRDASFIDLLSLKFEVLAKESVAAIKVVIFYEANQGKCMQLIIKSWTRLAS